MAQKQTHVKLVDSKKKKNHPKGNYKRANTNVGIMNRFILQFSRVEKAYRNIEDAFNHIEQTKSPKTLKARMARKCNIKKMRSILTYLGFNADLFTDDELSTLFDKNVKSDSQITFQRVLIGVGLCYYAQLKKEKEKENAEEDEGSEVIHDDKLNNDIILPPDYDNDDSKKSEKEIKFDSLHSGLSVVKKMFDVIDEDGSGEISSDEFKQAFTDICRDPEIVEQRMKELDYNNDQNISFKEFIFGISCWCGFNDDMENDSNDKDLDNPTSPLKDK